MAGLLPHRHADALGDAARRHVLRTDQRDHVVHPELTQAPVTPRRGRFGRDPLTCAAWRDRPSDLDLLDPVDHLRHGSAVAEELPRLAVLDRPQAVAVPLLPFEELLDPRAGLLAAERVRVEAHVLRVGLDLVERVQVREIVRERSEPESIRLDDVRHERPGYGGRVATKAETLEVAGRDIRVTNPDKVVLPRRARWSDHEARPRAVLGRGRGRRARRLPRPADHPPPVPRRGGRGGLLSEAAAQGRTAVGRDGPDHVPERPHREHAGDGRRRPPRMGGDARVPRDQPVARALG